MLMASERSEFSSHGDDGGAGDYSFIVDDEDGADVTIDLDMFLNMLEKDDPGPSLSCPSYSTIEAASECGSTMGPGQDGLSVQTDVMHLYDENSNFTIDGSSSECSEENKERWRTNSCTSPSEIPMIGTNRASCSGHTGDFGFSHRFELSENEMDLHADVTHSYGQHSNVSDYMTQPAPIIGNINFMKNEVADPYKGDDMFSETHIGGFEDFALDTPLPFDCNGFSAPARLNFINNISNGCKDAVADERILPPQIGKFVGNHIIQNVESTLLSNPVSYPRIHGCKDEGKLSLRFKDKNLLGEVDVSTPENNAFADTRRPKHKMFVPNRAKETLFMDESNCLSLRSFGNSLSTMKPLGSRQLSFIDTKGNGNKHMITSKSDPLTMIHKDWSTDLQNYTMGDDDDDVCILDETRQPGHASSSPAGRISKGAPRQVVAEHYGVSRPKVTEERLILRAVLQDMSQPKNEAVPPDGYLAMELLRHQRIALSWMAQKETASFPCCGGILADDQGLGKTISTIALILKEKAPSRSNSTGTGQAIPETLNVDEEDNQFNGSLVKTEMCPVKTETAAQKGKGVPSNKGRAAAGTLIVCPTSLIRQWAEEFRSKVTTKANISVLIYHGSNRTKDPYELAKHDVVITTYSIVSMEVPKQALNDKDEDDKRYHESDSIFPSAASKKRKYPSSMDNECSGKGAESTVPKPSGRPLSRVNWFRVVLDEAQSVKNHRTRAAQACWGLRAKRRWCLSGTPIQNAVDDLYSYFRFLRFEPFTVYKTFCSRIKVPIKESPSKGYPKLQAILKMIMLRRTKGTLLDGEPIINLPPKSVELKKVEFSKEERDFYSKLEADSRAQFQIYAAAGTVKQNYVNILLLLLRLRQACNHPLLVQGHNSSSIWKASLETGKKLPVEKLLYLLNCLETSSAICGICNDPPEDSVVSICGHVFCNQCISEHLSCEGNQCPVLNCKVHLNISSVFSGATLNCCLSDHSSPSSYRLTCAGSDSSIPKQKPDRWFPDQLLDSSKIRTALEILNSLSKPQVCNVSAVSENCNYSETSLGTSPRNHGDAASTSDEISDLNTNNGSNSVLVVRDKAIVFSQWTRMLDLLEACLKKSPIQYRRLDGTMSVAARDKAVRDFNTLPEVTVVIMSLKAASLGLNMIAACRVLLLDLWWNPTTEDQAIDRAHRIGQTRPVTVFRLTVKDTVEDRILALQQKKREMVASAFGEDEIGSSQTRLTVDDLKYLFG